ncbi:lipase class 3 family protein [Panus rudis PR-1116 ss-1]|nr:lipase class 3 family protein [Panus rudis PR-1116 ss-1]
MDSTLALLILNLAAWTFAFPTPEVERRQAITTLSASQVSSFKPFTFYASAAYCQPANTLAWNCGVNCQANPTFEPIASGGDGDATQFWYVGFDPTLKTIIVAHQGTDTGDLLSDLTDLDFSLTGLNSTLFPGVSSDVQVHSGFADEQAITALSILAAVQSGIARFGTTQVTMVGHSLGGALALLDSVFLPLHLSNVTYRTITYGLPRVGNQQFADYVDSHAGGSLTHINNKEDPIPIVPGKFLGFHHPSGEVHIQDSGAWEACPGQDNPSTQCIVGDVPNIFESDESDHDGPYDGVEMGC